MQTVVRCADGSLAITSTHSKLTRRNWYIRQCCTDRISTPAHSGHVANIARNFGSQKLLGLKFARSANNLRHPIAGVGRTCRSATISNRHRSRLASAPCGSSMACNRIHAMAYVSKCNHQQSFKDLLTVSVIDFPACPDCKVLRFR